MMTGANLLVVEDEPLSRDVLVRMLESRGHHVSSVHDGPACLDRLGTSSPDLVLLDVSMPGMSGLDVLRTIRRDTGPDQLPVILVTALVDSDDVVAGLEAGANDYVVKPVNLPILLARINVCLRVRESVMRLVEAERFRVMLEALDDASRRLAQPMSAVIADLEQLADESSGELRERLVRTRDWAREMGDLVARFRKLAEYRTEPYTEGLGGFVAASLGDPPAR